jgi:hypothetical protein
MDTSSKPQLYFSYSGKGKVLYDKAFYFFGNKKDARPIFIQPDAMLNLCSFLLTTADRARQKQEEVARNPQAPSELLFSQVLSGNKDFEVRLELNTYEGKCWTWLKLYRLTNNEWRPCKGCVDLSNVDGDTLKEFYYKNVETNQNRQRTNYSDQNQMGHQTYQGPTGQPTYQQAPVGQPTYQGPMGQPTYQQAPTGQPTYQGGPMGQPTYQGGQPTPQQAMGHQNP